MNNRCRNTDESSYENLHIFYVDRISFLEFSGNIGSVIFKRVLPLNRGNVPVFDAYQQTNIFYS